MGQAKAALSGSTPAERKQASNAHKGKKQQPSGNTGTLAAKGGNVAINPEVK